LEIGKYTTAISLPISTPTIIMIGCAINDDSAVTAPSTSSSKKSATLPSMASGEPDSSPIHWRCQV